MEDFLNKKIDEEELCDRVYEFRRKLINTCEKFNLELISGSEKIKGFKTLKANDLLMVTKIDRCSRNTLEFLKLQEKLCRKNIDFISLDLPHSNDMAVNRLISTTLAAIATFETERRKERQRQGIEAAKKAGKYTGRKTLITKKLIDQVQNLKEKKNLSVSEISKLLGISRPTIYKVLKEELNYIPHNRQIKIK